MKKFNKVISHLNPRHLDDALGLIVAKLLNPAATIELVHPQQVPAEYINDESILVIDVGGVYNPKLNDFDHHQDPGLPASFELLLKEVAPEYANNDFVRGVSALDTGGPKKLAEIGLPASKSTVHFMKVFLSAIENNINNLLDILNVSSIDEMFDILSSDKLPEASKKLAEFVRSELGEQVPATPSNGYEKGVFNLLGLLKTEVAEKAVKDYKTTILSEFDKIKNATVLTINGLKVLVSNTPLTVSYITKFYPDWALLIMPNQFNPNHTNVVKNTSNPQTSSIQLNSIYNAVVPAELEQFTHKAGFLTVLNKPMSELHIEELVKFLANQANK